MQDVSAVGLPRRRLLRLAGAAAVAGAGKASAEIRGNVVIGSEGWLYPAWEDVRRVNLQRTRQVTQLIGQAVQILRAGRIEVALTLAPTKARIEESFLPAEFKSSREAQQRYAIALEELGRSGAVVPDFAAGLAALRDSQSEPVFFKTDTHWTAVGAEAAAMQLARDIAARVTLPASAKPGSKLGRTVTNTHSGDLLQALPEADRRAFPSEKFKIHAASVLQSGQTVAGGLLEDDAADVTIVGNSYMQPYFGFPFALSSELKRPVELVWKTARIGPYRTLLDYLGGTQFRAQRPRLLVWHLMEGSLEQMPDAANWWEQASTMPTDRFLSELRRLVGT